MHYKEETGCSSARLEYASGGRVVAGSNPVIPTDKKSIDNLTIVDAFCFISILSDSCGLIGGLIDGIKPPIKPRIYEYYYFGHLLQE